MTLDKQITIGYIIMLLIIVAVSLFCMFSIDSLKNTKSTIGDRQYTLTEIITGVTDESGEPRNVFEKESLFGAVKAADRQIAIAYMNIISVAVLAIIFGGVITVLFPRRITKPILSLVRAAENVKDGDYSYRVKDISGTDEIAKLVSSFNRMLSSIESEHGELEKKNAELEEKDALNNMLLEETRNFNRVLEEKVSEVKADLEKKHMELLRTEKLATIGEIATRIAHEIRNPLSGIAVALENLKSGNIYGERDGRIQEIISEVSRLDNIIKELFQLAKPREVSLVSGDPNELVERVVGLTSPGAKLKAIDVEVVPARGGNEIFLDFELMEQVLMNLVINAIDSIDGPGGKVTISSYNSGDTFNIEVSDTGSGIAPMNMERIFEPFFSTKKTGTGLGLAISKRIIEVHKGKITVESREEKGSRFTLTLPANLSEGEITTTEGV
ncbi:MAG: HAMP domain-containing protein [Candidatus Dadabacteria bacterium]|nr:HAMP domain-containing protein [Candidatus Dadabacteria bacterium]